MKLILILALLVSLPVSSLAFPDGSFDVPVKPDCWPEEFLEGYKPHRSGSLKKQAAVLQKRIEACEPFWFSQAQNSLGNLAQFSSWKYPMTEPFLKRVKLKLSDGRKLRGLLAIKGGGKPRDLVVIRCGVFCDTTGGSVASSAIMNVFEENPVHVLLLNSTTGLEYAKDNGASYLGGFDEGYQNLDAIQFILANQKAFGLKIRHVHMMGVSLGGLSTLFSSMYFGAVPEFTKLPVKSFLAVCPLVDAQSQFNDVLSKNFSLSGLIFERQLEELLSKLFLFATPIQRMLQTAGNSSESSWKLGAALQLSADYYEKNWQKFSFSKYLPKNGHFDPQSFLLANSITNYRNRFSSPTMVLHASDDVFVPFANNSEKLLSLQNDTLGVLRVDRGNHCAFPTGWGWPLFSSFVTRSLGLEKSMPAREAPLPPSLGHYFRSERLWETVKRSHYQWSISPGASHAKLRISYFNGHVENCGYHQKNFGPSGSPWRCQQQKSVYVPLVELAHLGMIPGPDSTMAGRMERYLNVHTRFQTSAGAIAIGENGEPAKLVFQGEFHPTDGVR